MSTITTLMYGHVAVVTFAAPPHNHVSVPLVRAVAERRAGEFKRC